MIGSRSKPRMVPLDASASLHGVEADSPWAFVSLIGPSGCGKSTLLRIIGDLALPTTGTVLVNGKPARQVRLDREYGLVFQTPTLFDGIGLMDRSAFERTAQIAHDYQIITTTPDAGTYRTDLAQKALEALNSQGLDSRGLDFKKRVVRVTKGGE
jgi:ABC-type sugar transport system ATPase subunit